MAKKGIAQSISHYLERLAQQGEGPVGAQDITAHIADAKAKAARAMTHSTTAGSAIPPPMTRRRRRCTRCSL